MHRKISNGITYIPGILMPVEGLNGARIAHKELRVVAWVSITGGDQRVLMQNFWEGCRCHWQCHRALSIPKTHFCQVK